MKRIQYLIISIIFISSCELVVDVDLPEFEPSLVLNGTISTDDTLITIFLSQDKDILANANNYDFKDVSDAEVILYEGESMLQELVETDPGIYVSTLQPVKGKTYTIKASKSGFESIEASTTIPLETPDILINSMSLRPTEYGGENIRLSYTINDKPGKDYYEIKLYVLFNYEESYYDEDLDSLIVMKSEANWEEIWYNKVGADLDEFEENSENYTLSDELFNGRSKEFLIEFDNPYWYSNYYDKPSDASDTTKLKMVVKKLNEEYYRYLVSSQLQYDVDGSPFSEPVQVYSNVVNGYGIFSSFNSIEVPFAISDGKLLK